MTAQCYDTEVWERIWSRQSLEELVHDYMEPLVPHEYRGFEKCITHGPFEAVYRVQVDGREARCIDVAAWIQDGKRCRAVIRVRGRRRGEPHGAWRWAGWNGERFVTTDMGSVQKLTSIGIQTMSAVMDRWWHEDMQYLDFYRVWRDDYEFSKLLDATRCFYCDVRLDEKSVCGACAIETDHIVAYSKGGSNRKNNLVTACRRCNQLKHNCYYLTWIDKRLPKLGVHPCTDICQQFARHYDWADVHAELFGRGRMTRPRRAQKEPAH